MLAWAAIVIFLVGGVDAQVGSMQSPEASCASGWTAVNNACFKYDSTHVTFAHAILHCGTLYPGATLAKISSAQQDDVVDDLITGSGDAWIGLNNTGWGWRWTDGTLLDDYNPIQLNNSTLGCARLFASGHSAGTWGTHSCSLTRAMVCHYEVNISNANTSLTSLVPGHSGASTGSVSASSSNDTDGNDDSSISRARGTGNTTNGSNGSTLHTKDLRDDDNTTAARNTSRNITLQYQGSTNATAVISDVHVSKQQSSSTDSGNLSGTASSVNASAIDWSNSNSTDSVSMTNKTAGNSTRDLTTVKQHNITNTTNTGSDDKVAQNQSSLDDTTLGNSSTPDITSNWDNGSMKRGSISTSSLPKKINTSVVRVLDKTTTTTSTTLMTATIFSSMDTWSLARVCKDLDDFAPNNIFSEWCVSSNLSNATVCLDAGCELHREAGQDKEQCVCSGRAKCDRINLQVTRTTCGEEADQAEVRSALLAAAAESGTCDADIEEWIRSRAARCCKSFPASACEKHAEVAHPCIGRKDFMPDMMMSRWCEFHGNNPSKMECIEAGCKVHNITTGGHFCHCESLVQCNRFGVQLKEATCIHQGIYWSDYRNMLSSARAAGTCVSQTTPWGADLGDFLRQQAKVCCRSFPLSVCDSALKLSDQSQGSEAAMLKQDTKNSFSKSSTTQSSEMQAAESTTIAVAQKLSMLHSPEAVATLLEEQELEAIDFLLSQTNMSTAQVRLPGPNGPVVAKRLSSQALAEGKIQVAIASDAGHQAEVSVPAAVLDSLPIGEDGVLVVSSLDMSLGLSINASGSDDVAGQVEAVLSISVTSSSSRSYVHVEGLSDPIMLTFPVNASPGVVCAFWDERESRWSQTGMQQVGGSTSSFLTCSTTHLTLFAAIAGEVKKTVMCAQSMVLSEQSLAALGVGKWFLRWDAWMLWLLILLHVALIIAGFCLDGLSSWSDDQLLCCRSHHLAESCVGRCAAPARGMWSGCAALRTESLVELCGIVSHFLVNSCTTICQLVSPEDADQRTFLMRSFVSRLLAASLQNQTCATLQLDTEDVQFAAEWRRQMLKKTEHQDAWEIWWAPQHAWEVPTDGADAKQVHQIHCLVTKVGQHFDQHVWAVSCDGYATKKMASYLLRSQIPWLSVFRFSVFVPASMRGLLLSCRIFGAMFVISVFFQTSGQALVASSDQNCVEDPKGTVELLTQCLVVGLGSLVIARFPVCILARFNSRQFRFYESEDDRGRQLRAWRLWDMLMWIFGTFYLAICIMFLMTFLANINAGDATEWKIAISLELLSEFVLVPCVTAFFLLFTTKLTSKWVEAVREAAERVGCAVAGEIDRPRTPTAARVRLKAVMHEFGASALGATQSGDLQGSPAAAKLKLKAILSAFRICRLSEAVPRRYVSPVWPPLPSQLPPKLPQVLREHNIRECSRTELRCTSFCETTCSGV